MTKKGKKKVERIVHETSDDESVNSNESDVLPLEKAKKKKNDKYRRLDDEDEAEEVFDLGLEVFIVSLLS